VCIGNAYILCTISAALKEIPGMERDKSAKIILLSLLRAISSNVTEGEKVTEIFFQQVLHY
jgi:hypothetical protein